MDTVFLGKKDSHVSAYSFIFLHLFPLITLSIYLSLLVFILLRIYLFISHF